MKTIPFYSSLIGEGTTNEILLYGLIETLAYKEGFCYASSDFMAEQIGLAKGTIRNLLSSLRKKEWVKIEVKGNKRLAITPLLLPKSVKTQNEKSCGKPVDNLCKTCAKPVDNLCKNEGERHSSVTLASFQRDALNRGENRGRIYKDIYINSSSSSGDNNNDKITDDSPALAGKGQGGQPLAKIKREDFGSELEYQEAVYARRTVKMDG